MKTSLKIILLLILHLVIFNGLFVLRFSLPDTFQHRQEWYQGTFKGGILDFIRLYNSNEMDGYYYEWSTVVLGKSFESSYPIEKRKKNELKDFIDRRPEFHLPYRDIPFEYPPLLALPLLLARLMSHDFVGFYRAFALLVSLAYGTCLWITYRFWQTVPSSKKMGFPQTLTLSLASILALGPIYVTRLDVFASLLYLLALKAFIDQRFLQTTFWIVLGFFTKGYSLLLAPLLGIFLIQQKRIRAGILSTGLTVLFIATLIMGLTFVTEGKYLDSFRFHSSRGIQIESLYALIPYCSHLFFQTPLHIFESHYSITMSAPTTPLLLKISSLLPFLVFAFVYKRFIQALKKISSANEYSPIILSSALLLVFSFFLTFKVLSPQFLIWLTPLIFVMNPPHRNSFFLFFVFTLFLTQLIWPNFYSWLEKAEPRGIYLLLARNLGLVVLFIWLSLEKKETPRLS